MNLDFTIVDNASIATSLVSAFLLFMTNNDNPLKLFEFLVEKVLSKWNSYFQNIQCLLNN